MRNQPSKLSQDETKMGPIINWELYGFISKMKVDSYIVYIAGDNDYKDEMESLDMFLNDYLGWEIEYVGTSLTALKKSLIVVVADERD